MKNPSHLWDSELSKYRNVRHVRGIIPQPVRKCRFPQRRLLNSNRVNPWKLNKQRTGYGINKKYEDEEFYEKVALNINLIK